VTLLKTDAVVEDVHFLPDADAEDVGWKAIARVLSDFAAMGGSGREFLVTLAIPAKTPVEWVERLYAGMDRCAQNHGASIVGGETTAVPAGSVAVISVAGRGEAPRGRVVTRAGGESGDVLFVTGSLGGSLKGRHLTFPPRLREAAWLAENVLPRAMMDLSDGLARDLPRLAAASGCGFEVNREAVPCNEGCSVEQALGDGEDFELLLAVAAEDVNRLLKTWPQDFPKLSNVGALTAHGGDLAGGWGHFENK